MVEKGDLYEIFVLMEKDGKAWFETTA